jgi:hypothetical protein
MLERKSDRWRTESFGRVFGPLLEVSGGAIVGIKFFRING